MKTHTPGPWIAVANPMRNDSMFVVRDIPAEPYPGGGGAFPGEPPRMQLPPAICHSGMPAADARLIAAAPDLLAALAVLHRMCRDCDLEVDAERPTEEQYCAAMDAAEAAMAKAEGA